MYPMENELSNTSSNVSIGSLYIGMMRNALRLPWKAAPMTKQYIIHDATQHLREAAFQPLLHCFVTGKLVLVDTACGYSRFCPIFVKSGQTLVQNINYIGQTYTLDQDKNVTNIHIVNQHW